MEITRVEKQLCYDSNSTINMTIKANQEELHLLIDENNAVTLDKCYCSTAVTASKLLELALECQGVYQVINEHTYDDRKGRDIVYHQIRQLSKVYKDLGSREESIKDKIKAIL